ncbi:Pentatricopeptide repeat-containing protein [Hibiscus syriacus]|uniref:Pentatricopeptide repeat-containing protein n=1 Tax=Hibiscus syriacus TaxID=106335 RepID=A0A6A3ASU7_HIBSY|nr:Pentatricopeptide repeat-containing protein [Hibiscus syriacus]
MYPEEQQNNFNVPLASSSAAATSIPIASVSRHFPTSVLSWEQHDDGRAPLVLQFFKEDKAYPEATNEQLENWTTLPEGKTSDNFVRLGSEQRPSLLELGENPSSYSNMQTVAADTEEIMNVEPSNIVSLAKKALSASKQAAELAEDLDLGSADSFTLPVEEEEAVTVRSTRHFERQSKRRRQYKFMVSETYSSRKTNVRKKSSGSFNPSDPLRLFLRGPETTQLLTAKEESELIIQVQDLMRLMNVKSKLQSQFGREPTLEEWAEVMGLSCSALQAEFRTRNKSRDKLIYANFRMVVHVAKQYQGRGLNLPDLLQEGSMGLIKSVREVQTASWIPICHLCLLVDKASHYEVYNTTFQNHSSAAMNLLMFSQENVYSLLGKVVDTKRSYIREGNHRPSKEELASRVGMSVEKLDKLLFTARTPLSIQQSVWSDQDTTFQEVTPDTGIEIPDVSVAKKLMSQHGKGEAAGEQGIIQAKEMPRRTGTWCICRFGYLENKGFEEANRVFDYMMKMGFKIDERSCILYLVALKKFDEGDSFLAIFRRMVKSGVEVGVCSMTIVIDGLCRRGEVEKGRELMSEMSSKGVKPIVITYNTILNAYVKRKDFGVVYEVLRLMEEGVAYDTATYTVLIEYVGKIGKHDEVEKLFDEMRERMVEIDVHLYTSMIHWHCRRGSLKKAIALFDELTEKGLVPNAHVYGVV